MNVKNVNAVDETLVHVETPLGLVNIWTGLVDGAGRRVNRIEVHPNEGAGELRVVTDEGIRAFRMIETGSRNG